MRLGTRDLSVQFEGIHALAGVDLDLDRGEILGLIGPNGAGKTTLVNVLSGFQRPTGGDLFLDGERVTGMPARKLARMGVARTFQGVRPFPTLSVFENVACGALGVGASPKHAEATAWEVLERLRLRDRAGDRAADLPHGEERRLGIARAVAGRPTFLLLDEPAAGLDEDESDQLVRDLRALRDEVGYGLMVIEHDMRVIMSLCERVHVLDEGRTISVGTPAEIRSDPAVLTAYLGTERGAPVARD